MYLVWSHSSRAGKALKQGANTEKKYCLAGCHCSYEVCWSLEVEVQNTVHIQWGCGTAWEVNRNQWNTNSRQNPLVTLVKTWIECGGTARIYTIMVYFLCCSLCDMDSIYLKKHRSSRTVFMRLAQNISQAPWKFCLCKAVGLVSQCLYHILTPNTTAEL